MEHANSTLGISPVLKACYISLPALRTSMNLPCIQRSQPLLDLGLNQSAGSIQLKDIPQQHASLYQRDLINSGHAFVRVAPRSTECNLARPSTRPKLRTATASENNTRLRQVLADAAYVRFCRTSAQVPRLCGAIHNP